MLDAIGQIELIAGFSLPGREVFLVDVMMQSAILHRLTLLGEACRAVSAETRERHPEIPWPHIICVSECVGSRILRGRPGVGLDDC